MVSAIASSMITVAGVTFSITIAALSQASQQYTPRILRNFMRDRSNQIVLGSFAGIYVYCLTVLRTIRVDDEATGAFVPSISIWVAFLHAVAGTALLVYFIHHVARSLQASKIIADVAEETIKALEEHFPEARKAQEEAATRKSVQDTITHWEPVPAPSTGYVQTVEIEPLLRASAEHDIVVRIEHGPGHFVISGLPIAWIGTDTSKRRTDDASISRVVASCFGLGNFRTVEQDPAFGIRQIVDTAIKALSPGINDTTTAATAVHYLCAILVHIADRALVVPKHYHEGKLRIFGRHPDFADVLALAFDQIRQNGSGNVAILLGQLESLEILALNVTPDERRKALADQSERIGHLASSSISEASDLAMVRDRLERTRQAIASGEPALHRGGDRARTFGSEV